MKINRLPVFTQEVFYFKMPNFNDYQEQIKQIVLVENNKNIHNHTTSPKEQCNVMAKRTAWNSHERYNILHLICDEIKENIQFFVKEEGYDIPKINVKDCWLNWYNKNHYSQPHYHGNDLSVILFVDVEDSDSEVFFHADNSAVFVKKTESDSNFSNIKKVNVKNGDVIFFDGNVYHSVSPNTSDNMRITMAINFSVYYDQERNEY
tara:strand:- start:955 stop:1572 length:618 start_codon:yes stop_codon:yes gene_type:complete